MLLGSSSLRLCQIVERHGIEIVVGERDEPESEPAQLDDLADHAIDAPLAGLLAVGSPHRTEGTVLRAAADRLHRDERSNSDQWHARICLRWASRHTASRTWTPPPQPGSRRRFQVDANGIGWLAQYDRGQIVRLDTETGAFKEYQLPGEQPTPYPIGIDTNNQVWYASGIMDTVGRLDPTTGKVTEWQTPSGPKAQPYGISTINDVIWYSESGSTPNTIVRFDPKTTKFQSWAIPGGGNIVRNTSVTPDGDFVLANSLVNSVTLVTIKK